MKDLFLFTLGPVKEFIEGSRKLMDLYAGSSLLSEIMREAVCYLEQEEKIKILFPHVPDSHKNGPANIPNRVVAVFSDYSEKQKCEIADNLSAFVKNSFTKMCLEMMKTAGINQRGMELAKKQWDDFLEIYWIFENYSPNCYWETYQRMLTEIYKVKGIRIFSQTTEPWGRKCMLFPKYNAIFAKLSDNNGKSVYPYHVNPNYVCDITENHFLNYVVKPREALSSIALVKRIYGKTATDLYSTRYMLLSCCVPQTLFTESGVSSLRNEQRDMLANGVYDLANGHVLDEEEYDKEVIQKAGHLYDRMKKNSVKLSSYYAVIKFDGDNMGDAFKSLQTVEEQQNLSDNISNFAYKAPEIIKGFGGLSVFAGGEDFLGFLPLKELFSCVSMLHKEFYHIIKQSFSVGISIAHLMQPLKEVMAEVDAMEASAKRMEGKNAFAISIMKRSGTKVRMPAYKLTDKETVPQWEDIRELVQTLNESQCSRSMFFNIARMMKGFSEEQVKPDHHMVEILLRNYVYQGELDEKQINRERVVQKLMLFYKSQNQVEDFLHTIDDIAFLSREVAG